MKTNYFSPEVIAYYPEIQKLLELRTLFFSYLEDPEKFKLLTNRIEEFDLTIQDLFILALHLSFIDNKPTTKYNKDAVLDYSPDLY